MAAHGVLPEGVVHPLGGFAMHDLRFGGALRG